MFAGYAVRSSEPVAYKSISLSPPQKGVSTIRTFAAQVLTDGGAGVSPSEISELRPWPVKGYVHAGQALFGIVIKPDRPGTYRWSGLRIDYSGGLVTVDPLTIYAVRNLDRCPTHGPPTATAKPSG